MQILDVFPAVEGQHHPVHIIAQEGQQRRPAQAVGRDLKIGRQALPGRHQAGAVHHRLHHRRRRHRLPAEEVDLQQFFFLLLHQPGIPVDCRHRRLQIHCPAGGAGRAEIAIDTGAVAGAGGDDPQKGG